jgi:O-antigen/teichoic acid export membrane protein
VVGTVLLMRALPSHLRSAPPSYATREWLQASIPMMLVAGAWTLNNYIGTLVAGTLAGSEAAGVYTIVQNSAAVAVLFMVAANMPLAPAVARLHAHGDKAALERTAQHVGWIALLVSAPVCLALAIFPETFLGFFGADFEDGATALTIVALAQLVNAATGPAGNVLLMTGHELAAARAVGIGAATNLAIAIALVPALGVTGSAIAYASSLVLWNVAMVVIARRRLGIIATALRWLSIAQGRD